MIPCHQERWRDRDRGRSESAMSHVIWKKSREMRMRVRIRSSVEDHVAIRASGFEIDKVKKRELPAGGVVVAMANALDDEEITSVATRRLHLRNHPPRGIRSHTGLPDRGVGPTKGKMNVLMMEKKSAAAVVSTILRCWLFLVPKT